MMNVPFLSSLSRDRYFGASTVDPSFVSDSAAPRQIYRDPPPNAHLQCYESRSFDPATGSPRGRSRGLPDLAARIRSAMQENRTPTMEFDSARFDRGESEERTSGAQNGYNLRSRARALAPDSPSSSDHTQFSHHESDSAFSSENSSPRSPASSPKIQRRRHSSLSRLREEIRHSNELPASVISYVQGRHARPPSGIAVNLNIHSLDADLHTDETTAESYYQQYSPIGHDLASLPLGFAHHIPNSGYENNSVAEYGEASFWAIAGPSIAEFDYEGTQSDSGIYSYEPAQYGSLLSALGSD